MPTCKTCNNSGEGHPRLWHHWRHQFVSVGDDAPPVMTEQPPVVDVLPPMPFDPVLRQALIDKGVLTVEDLNNAEAKIRVVSNLFKNRMEATGDGTEQGGSDDPARIAVRAGDLVNDRMADGSLGIQRPGDGTSVANG